MANQTECTICTKAKQGGYGEIKCSFYGRKPQFDDTPCPHYSKNETSGITECECQSDSSNARCPECGPEVSQQSSTCSTCGFPMKDDENGNTITSPNNGDTSTDGLNGTLRCPDCGQEVPQTSSTCPNCGCPLKEQENENNVTPQKDCGTDTGVLNEVSWCPQCGQKVPQMSNFCPKCGCSFKEYVNNNGDTRATPSSRPHKKNGTTKFTSKRSIIVVAIIVLIASIITFVFMSSLSQNEIQKRQERAEAIERRIITPEDFYVFASQASDTSSCSDIDDVIQCMSAEKFVNLVDKYVNYLVHFPTTDASRAKVYAIMLSALPMYISDDKEQYKKLQVDVLGNSPFFNLTNMILGWSIGNDGFENVQHEYVRAIKDNGKLYKGKIIPLENLSEYTLSSTEFNTEKTNRNADYGTTKQLREESRTLNGVWSYQSIDPSTYDVWEYSLVFRGNQFKFKSENSGGRASEGEWLDYKISGNDIYIDGKRLYTIESNGSIQRIQDGQIFSK